MNRNQNTWGLMGFLSRCGQISIYFVADHFNINSFQFIILPSHLMLNNLNSCYAIITKLYAPKTTNIEHCNGGNILKHFIHTDNGCFLFFIFLGGKEHWLWVPPCTKTVLVTQHNTTTHQFCVHQGQTRHNSNTCITTKFHTGYIVSH